MIIKRYIIGEINFSNYIIESIGKPVLKGLGKCVISVYGNEGQIPHFHIESKNKPIHKKGEEKSDPDYCVHIESNYFFNHSDHPMTFNDKNSTKALDTWLRKGYKDGKETNWAYIRRLWEELNPKCVNNNKLLKVKKQPDYTKLKLSSNDYEDKEYE